MCLMVCDAMKKQTPPVGRSTLGSNIESEKEKHRLRIVNLRPTHLRVDLKKNSTGQVLGTHRTSPQSWLPTINSLMLWRDDYTRVRETLLQEGLPPYSLDCSHDVEWESALLGTRYFLWARARFSPVFDEVNMAPWFDVHCRRCLWLRIGLV